MVFRTTLEFEVRGSEIRCYREKDNSCRWFKLFILSSRQGIVSTVRDWQLIDFPTMMGGQIVAFQLRQTFFEGLPSSSKIESTITAFHGDTSSPDNIGLPRLIDVWLSGTTEEEALMALLSI